MRRVLREQLKNVVAIVALVLIALLTLLVILANQKAALPGWIPGLGQDFYEINAQFETAQAVTPGQGQAVMIAGIQVGKVGSSTLEDGVAKVRLDIEPKYKDILHSDLEFLLRPRTGLNDMSVQIDPGTSGSAPEEGSTIPLAQGTSNVQADQFLNILDTDTRDYLTLLLNAAGEGLGDNGRNLSNALRRFEPLARYTAELNGELEERRQNIRSGVHAFSQIATELGENDQLVGEFVSNSRASLENFAVERESVQAILREFPPTLAAAQEGLRKSSQLSSVMRPALTGLIPGAKNLKESLESLQGMFRATRAPIRDEIRPFTRQVQPVFTNLKRTSKPLAKTSTNLKGSFRNLNNLLNLLAYNPPGDASEGYLFWAPWASHNFNSALSNQDAMGAIRRGLTGVTCDSARSAERFWDVAGGPQATFLQLHSVYSMVQLPPPDAIENCRSLVVPASSDEPEPIVSGGAEADDDVPLDTGPESVEPIPDADPVPGTDAIDPGTAETDEPTDVDGASGTGDSSDGGLGSTGTTEAAP